jgi:S1-C subfamily serine protease
LGPKPVDTLLFQAPIRNGFSGSPIFDSSGRVIGIEDTKVFGISPALGALRDKWAATLSGGSVRIMGIDIAGSFTETINNLDQNLISGLGSGVAIHYARDLK